MSAEVELTQKLVKELLDYFPETGAFVWKPRCRRWFETDQDFEKWNKYYAGKAAFTSRTNAGYIQGELFGKGVLGHRIAFLWMMGRHPDPEVDHVNHVRDDNRWVNLREADRRINTRNQSMHARNTSGRTGVYWFERDRKWTAS